MCKTRLQAFYHILSITSFPSNKEQKYVNTQCNHGTRADILSFNTYFLAW